MQQFAKNYLKNADTLNKYAKLLETPSHTAEPANYSESVISFGQPINNEVNHRPSARRRAECNSVNSANRRQPYQLTIVN
jgi:hypothetical protein